MACTAHTFDESKCVLCHRINLDMPVEQCTRQQPPTARAVSIIAQESLRAGPKSCRVMSASCSLRYTKSLEGLVQGGLQWRERAVGFDSQ